MIRRIALGFLVLVLASHALRAPIVRSPAWASMAQSPINQLPEPGLVETTSLFVNLRHHINSRGR